MNEEQQKAINALSPSGLVEALEREMHSSLNLIEFHKLRVEAIQAALAKLKA